MNDKYLSTLRSVLDFAAEVANNLDRLVDLSHELDSSLSKANVVDKLVAETTLLALLASRVSGEGHIARRVKTIATLIAPYARTARHLRLLASAPQTVAGAASAHVMLQRLGARDDRFDECVGAAFSSLFVQSTDRPNFRQLEFLWLEGLHTGQRANFGTVSEQSTILCEAHPIFMRREDAYAVTHAAMYLSNFGIEPLSTAIRQPTLSRFVDHCVSWCLSANDWDLLGEVLITNAVSDCGSQEYVALGEKLLVDLFELHRAIPGPNYRRDEHMMRLGRGSRDYLLVQGYHSTYVYGILCCIRLLTSRPGSVHAQAVAAEVWRKYGDGYWEWLRGEAPAPFIGVVSSVAASEVLANAALIAACRSGSYSDVLHIMEQPDEKFGTRVLESRSAAAEHVMQAVRAAAYERSAC